MLRQEVDRAAQTMIEIVSMADPPCHLVLGRIGYQGSHESLGACIGRDRTLWRQTGMEMDNLAP